MRRKHWQRLCALFCLAAFILTFMACGKKTNTENTTEESESQSETATQSTAEPETDTAPSSEGDSLPVDSSHPEGIQKPTDAAQGVALFNEAIKKVKKVEATYSRTLEKANALNIDLMNLGVAPEFDLDNQPLPNPSVVAINASDIAGYQFQEQGNNYMLTFKLKDFSGNAASTHGASGFMYFIDFNETKNLVDNIAKKLSKGLLKITMYEEGFSVQLTGGELVATIDKTSGAPIKGTLSFTETVTSKVKATLVGEGEAKIVGHGSGTFLFQ